MLRNLKEIIVSVDADHAHGVARGVVEVVFPAFHGVDDVDDVYAHDGDGFHASGDDFDVHFDGGDGDALTCLACLLAHEERVVYPLH